MQVTAQTFKSIAERKGVKISINEPLEIHLDMNMIEASLEMAIQNISNEQIKIRLRRLQETGTDAQKVDFVMGEGEYYFPEDIEMLASRSRANNGLPAAEGNCFKVCEVTYYVVCRCLGNSEQVCFDKAKRICTIQCE